MGGNGRAEHDRWLRDALERHEGPLLRYACRLVGDLEQARDVVQETFLRLCREDPAQLDGHLAPWLYRVCRSRALDLHRKEGRMRDLVEDLATPCVSHEPAPDYAAETHDDHQSVTRWLSTLPVNQQEVVRLKFQAGLSYKEISEITNLTVTNVGFLLHTAIKSLRAKMA
jgi:RNA polymerase sigma factor (sigma-70 family)